jgi:hypothetical protein
MNHFKIESLPIFQAICDRIRPACYNACFEQLAHIVMAFANLRVHRCVLSCGDLLGAQAKAGSLRQAQGKLSLRLRRGLE